MAEDNILLKETLNLVAARNNAYKSKYRYLLLIYLLSFAIIAVLSCILVYVWGHPPRPVYFSADKAGRLILDPSTAEPNMTTQEVMAWAIEAVEAANTYNYVNYHGQFQKAQKYFSEFAWRDYMRALKQSNNLVALTTRKYVVISRVVGPPRVIAEGILSGAYAWKIEMPMLSSYYTSPYDDKNKFNNALNVTVVIQRQNVLKSYKGLAIVQMIESMDLPDMTGPQAPLTNG